MTVTTGSPAAGAPAERRSDVVTLTIDGIPTTVAKGTLIIRAAEQLWEVVVQGLCEQRRPAVEAQGLYQETEAGREARLRQQELKKLAPEPLAEQRGRPTKRDRRQMEKTWGDRWSASID